VARVNYNDHASLVSAMRGQDCLIITMGVTAPPDSQTKLIDAAADANVPWIIPNEFGMAAIDDSVTKDVLVGEAKVKVRRYIEELGKSSWLGIACGFWYEFSLGGGEERYGFDLDKRTALFYGDGTAHMNTSTFPQVGRGVAALLALKVLPEDENDKSVTLSQYRNKMVKFSSFTVNQREMLESLMRVTGTTEKDWTIREEPVVEYYKKSIEQMMKGDRKGFARAMYSRLFYPDEPGDYEKVLGSDNEKLGLPKEDIDEFTKIAIQMHEGNYFGKKYGS
jgi:hypothetical protein